MKHTWPNTKFSNSGNGFNSFARVMTSLEGCMSAKKGANSQSNAFTQAKEASLTSSSAR